MANKPAFSLIEIEPGRRIHYLLEGPEEASVVLYDAGSFGIYADGWWIKEALKKDFRVCLYDRVGMGASDPAPDGIVPSPEYHVSDMRRLMAALKIKDPFMLIGHSMAGLRLHTYANLYPENLSGLILIDAVSPRRLKDVTGGFFGPFGQMLRVGAYGARLGLAEPLSRVFAPNNFRLDGQLREDKVWGYGAASHHAASRDEVLGVDPNAPYLHGNGIENLPLAILTATIINSMTEQDAKTAEENTGYGWYGNFPKEDHVSILIGDNATIIADRVREIHHHVSHVRAA
ncbi:alpha/beta fold hydrolase [Parvularcula sp. IMCC14364]|uniref:alpha/beta fold hydrolase n=1 Tax=Parvularcula sp. IMCC14364 TaxID=3067902 RepID=UPI002740F6E4|nr:alpha/beta hydrolase [Parvularcula sp. IMCC14364]